MDFTIVFKNIIAVFPKCQSSIAKPEKICYNIKDYIIEFDFASERINNE